MVAGVLFLLGDFGFGIWSLGDHARRRSRHTVSWDVFREDDQIYYGTTPYSIHKMPIVHVGDVLCI
jgi:hypothetical protein